VARRPAGRGLPRERRRPPAGSPVIEEPAAGRADRGAHDLDLHAARGVQRYALALRTVVHDALSHTYASALIGDLKLAKRPEGRRWPGRTAGPIPSRSRLRGPPSRRPSPQRIPAIRGVEAGLVA
jgi:hypothetical protein